MPDDKSPNRNINITTEETVARLDESDKSLQIHLTGEQYTVVFKGKDKDTTLTLEESIHMWQHMTNWLLNMAEAMQKNSSLPVSKQVLNALVTKITHECDVARKKEQEEKSSIIIP